MGFLGWLLLYCLLIVVASLAGGLLTIVIRFTHRRMQLATSFVAGFMLGIALLHLMPHALMSAPAAPVAAWMTTGLILMFLLERFFTYHHHDAPSEDNRLPVTADAEFVQHCEFAPGDPIDHGHGHDHRTMLSWSGTAVGLILHSIIAGIALAANMQSVGHERVAWPGLAVLLVIVLHKPFDSMTLLTLVIRAGYRKSIGHLINVLFALAVPAGAMLLLIGLGEFVVDAEHSTRVGYATAFAAGVFLCVSLSDLLPELHFHRHDRVKLTLMLLLGLTLAWIISGIETQTHHLPHDHNHLDAKRIGHHIHTNNSLDFKYN